MKREGHSEAADAWPHVVEKPNVGEPCEGT